MHFIFSLLHFGLTIEYTSNGDNFKQWQRQYANYYNFSLLCLFACCLLLGWFSLLFVCSQISEKRDKESSERSVCYFLVFTFQYVTLACVLCVYLWNERSVASSVKEQIKRRQKKRIPNGGELFSIFTEHLGVLPHAHTHELTMHGIHWILTRYFYDVRCDVYAAILLLYFIKIRFVEDGRRAN